MFSPWRGRCRGSPLSTRAHAVCQPCWAFCATSPHVATLGSVNANWPGSPMKKLLARLAADMSYTALPTWRLPELPLANCLRDLFVARGITTVIDVGANLGQDRNFLRAQ